MKLLMLFGAIVGVGIVGHRRLCKLEAWSHQPQPVVTEDVWNEELDKIDVRLDRLERTQ